MGDDFISTPEQLKQLCAGLRSSTWLALDTEFMREKTYYGQLCLIQVANDEATACIDPLALDSLDPLLELLLDPKTTKVLHAARQDLELFHDLSGQVPTPIFDTQLAATLCGYGEQLGYANLVSKVTGTQLNKTQTRTDWSRRPLSPEQINYARDDVIYLRDVYHHLHNKLRQRNRLAWLNEDFDELANPETYRSDPQRTWRRIKGHGKLRGQQLHLLRALAAWREQQAQSSDRPRGWILRDEVLLDLARLKPENIDQLDRIRGLEKKTMERRGKQLLRVIDGALQDDETQWPTPPPKLQPSPQQGALVDSMMAIVRLKAAENELGAGALANRGDLERVICGDASVPVLHGWRKAVVGDELMGWMKGESALSVKHGALTLA